MNLTLKKLAALLLTVLLVVSLFSTVTFAANGQKREKLAIPTIENGHGFTPAKITGNRALTESYLRGDAAQINATLPSRYDGRDYNYLTPVKNQLDSPASSDEQTCWTFATIASVEAYMIKHGVIDAATGLPATTSMDLSESHLAWFTYTNAYDKKGMLNGDSSTPYRNYVINTGHYYMSTYTLMRWEGVASESTEALKYTNMSTSGLNSQYAYNYDVAHVTKVEWIPMSNRDAVKRAIMEYGAGGIGYCSDPRFYSADGKSFCIKQYYTPDDGDLFYGGNHAVTIVGWDDNYSKNNFVSSYGPSGNGAWIIRDSYGTDEHEGGYFYLSYEDSASYYENAYFYAADNVNNYTNCYQYDGTGNYTLSKALRNNCQIANIFTASGAESLKAVALATFDEAVTYTVQVYKNPTTASNPTSGTLMTTQNGYIAYPGYTTINLNNPVALNANDVFAVVFTLSTPSPDSSGFYVHAPYDGYAYLRQYVTFRHANHGDTSYYREANGSWYDAPSNGDFRIKAYTDPSTSTHTHSYGAWTSNNNGTHSRTCSCGDKQTANCTYRDVVTAPTSTSQGYTTHTCTVCGYSYKDSYTNPVTTNYTVTFSVPSGVTAPASQTVAANSYVTLPTASAPSGYTFKGWVTSAVSDTTTMPSYLTGSYKVTGNVTLRALYAYTTTSGGSGVSGYQLVTSAPSSWAGNYVITYGTASSSMYLLKGVTPSSNGAKIESSANAASFANSGASLSNNVLTNVANNYVFTLAAHGSYYSVQNASTGAYLGVNSSGYLSCYTTYTSGSCDWTPGVGTSASSMKSAYGGSYPYLGFTTGSKYFWAGSSVNTSVRLWKQTSGSGSSTTHYTTSPTTSSHTHSYGSWYSNNNGTHSRTCSCGDKQTANCTYRDVVTAPTTTSQGYTTHTCTVCGYSYKDSYTNPIDNTTYYTVTFSTPSGVTAPASQTVAANSYVTLPTASAPSGYTFKGWVTSAVSNTTTMPSYLTGSYKVTGNITLRALYSYTSTSGGSGTTYTLVGSTPSSWAGNYIITYGTNTGSMYVMKGLSGEVKYETSTSGSAVLLANTGMTYSNGTLTGATAPYIFKVAADGSYYTIQNSSTGTYVASKSSYLYSLPSYNSSYCRWTLSCSSNNVTAKNTASSSYCYLSCYTSSKYFMLNSSVPTGLYFWKQTSTGGTSTTYYTTG